MCNTSKVKGSTVFEGFFLAECVPNNVSRIPQRFKNSVTVAGSLTVKYDSVREGILFTF